jgi:nucleoside 2-deoxyribosyltransferase
MKIYLARPISGQSYEAVVNYYTETAKKLIIAGYDVLCPMTGKSYMRNEIEFKAHDYDNKPMSTNHAIIERDRWMVSSADIVYANLLDSKYASIGTCMELAWAHDKGKHTIVVMDKENVHQHAFVIEAADIVYETHKEAMEYLETLSKGIVPELVKVNNNTIKFNSNTVKIY